jgi:hypothetical protein
MRFIEAITIAIVACGIGGSASAATSLETCVAVNAAEMKAGHSVYMLSAEFTVYDPSSRDAATAEWTKYATSRGFDSMGCDSNSYKIEVAAVPQDTKIISSNWKPSRNAVMAGADQIKSGKRNYRNASTCVQNIANAIQNKCDYPVKVGFCFGEQNSGVGDTFDKTCQRQKFALTATLAPNEQSALGIYHYVYFFACELPSEPQNMFFDGSAITGVCTAP